MIPIGIQKVSKRFGATVALEALDLAIQPGELFFLLGPSGCGKTTLLRCLAGFERPDTGSIRFGEQDVTRLPPHERNAGMVFQSYALWPHLTVEENVAFGLEERRVPAAELERRTAQALEAVQLGALGARKPHQLSGGQQQRVALARALVVRPRCLLLDEPLSNLDARLRSEMRSEIRRVCKQHQLTTIYVTHDQKEALAIADRMAVMDAGRILQLGTPREIYARPATAAVARFIGETNLIAGRIVGGENGRLLVDTPVCRFHGLAGDPNEVHRRGAEVLVSVRPECWRLSRQSPAMNAVRGRITETAYLGELAQHRFVSGESELKLFELNPRFVGAAAQGELWAAVDPEDVVVLKP
ncbi:MAG TPA: ABC transporter ATP-binding protein [Opitutaceae bacterium]|nr:ABC transporter ATP-binding protein [Opitutaceae bacterium]